MKTLSKVAIRNLNRQKKRSFLLGGAIAFGIFIVTSINGIAAAFQDNVAANLAQLMGGHIFVEGVEKTEKGKNFAIIRDDKALLEALDEAGFHYDSISRRTLAYGKITFSGKKADQGIFGVDFYKEPFLRDRVQLVAGSWDRIREPGAFILNEAVAKKLNLEIDDKVTYELNTVTGQKNFGELVLVGISIDMGFLGEQIAYAEQSYLNRLMDMGPGEYSLFTVMLKKMDKADPYSSILLGSLKKHAPVFELPIQAASSIVTDENAAHQNIQLMSRQQQLYKLANSEHWVGSKYRVYSINDTVSFIEDIVAIVNTISFTILFVLFLIIMVGISNTFRMIMFERIKEIGTMRALGMQKNSVRNLFLLESSFLALGGIIAGWLVSLIFMLIFSSINFGTDSILSLFLKNGHFGFQFQPFVMLGHCILVIVLTIVAALIPARNAAKLSPALALRTAK